MKFPNLFMITDSALISRLFGRLNSLQNSNLLNGRATIDIVRKPLNCHAGPLDHGNSQLLDKTRRVNRGRLKRFR